MESLPIIKTSEAIAAFGSVRALAEGLRLSVQAVYKWGDEVPPLRAYQIRDHVQAHRQERQEEAA